MNWVTKDPEVVETILETGAVLLHLRTKFYYSLNKTAHNIWKQIDSSATSNEVAHKLMSIYDVEKEKLVGSITDFVNQLTQEELVMDSGDQTQSSYSGNFETGGKDRFTEPELIKHDEPLHEVSHNPFDPQLPLAE